MNGSTDVSSSTVSERVADNLNRALHAAFDRDPRVCLLGEDILDPYGGAFKIAKGLSTRYPDRVITTPISEAGVVGVAGGLALCGERPIVEVMFGDFIALAFDPILNFLTKSVAMYGHRVPMHVVLRCPVGGNRGYGPTHSQSPHKHLIGIPHLALFELSPFHDNTVLVETLLSRGEPCVLFENKVLYTERMHTGGVVDDLFSYELDGPGDRYARVFVDDPDDFDVVVIAPGGLTSRVVAAARDLLLRYELRCHIVIPAQLYPFDLAPLIPTLDRARLVCLVEEGTAGGTWSAEVAAGIYEALWGRLANPVLRVHSRDSVIPAARHLEEDVLVQTATIVDAIAEATGA
jgi:pyruvate/2-oxoglutarate/acetoin dehydrogenase E1 component